MEPQIDYWSYSSMSSLLSNPLNFKKKYILKVYDEPMSPSGVVGTACHKVAEAYFGSGKERDEAIDEGTRYIDSLSDKEIDFGKTGSREKILKEFTQAIQFFFEELPQYHEILGVEYSATTEITTVDGNTLPLPAKAKIDLISRTKTGEIEVIDWKFVRSYTDEDVTDFGKFLQAMFDYHIVKAKFDEAPARVIFREIKISKNKDNTPQLQDYVIDFNEGTIYGDFATFYKLYNETTKYISSPTSIYLPNPNDFFNGQNSFDAFRLGIIGTEAPVAVKRKVEQKVFVDKNFVASASDKVENANLSDEEKIRLKLQEFAMPVQMEETFVGATVTKYTLKPSRGIPMSKIARVGNDIALALGAESVRIEAPIRGTNLVGIEVPSKTRKRIDLADNHLKKGTTNIPIGIDVFGKVHYKDIADMPHLLIAGATGSGKSVMLNVILTALTKQNTADDLRLILVDPKQVELNEYAKVPHLDRPIVTSNEGAVEVIDYAVKLMEERYTLLSKAGVRNIEEYNLKSKSKLSKYVIVIDEFADLMMTAKKGESSDLDIKEFTARINNLAAFKLLAGKKITQKDVKETIAELKKDALPEVETSIIRIAQKARAVGIHLILATQRPSADVVTGLIKANIPTKIAFATTSEVNSRIILDESGAEELIGKGDMLYLDPNSKGLKRLQGLYK
jgi:RecB family exonuclease/energy-coupling factor transporter ATP-binding protein EcfA2